VVAAERREEAEGLESAASLQKQTKLTKGRFEMPNRLRQSAAASQKPETERLMHTNGRKFLQEGSLRTGSVSRGSRPTATRELWLSETSGWSPLYAVGMTGFSP